MAPPIKGMACMKCMYYEKTDANYGECRRYAPHPNAATFISKVDAVGSIKIDVHWPKVYDSNWCGQFSGRKPDQIAANKPKPTAVRPPTVQPPADSDEPDFHLAPETDAPEPAPRLDIE